MTRSTLTLEFAYNSKPHATQKESPFYLQMGYDPKAILGLGTSGSAGDPDPYPWVFWAPKVIPGSMKIFPTDHPEPWVKNPQVHRYPWVYL